MEPAEFEAIYRAHFKDLCNFAQSFIDAEAARDVVQDVLFDLWDRRGSVQINESLRGYLFGAVRNRALNVLRHDSTRTRVASVAENDSLALSEAPMAPAAAVEYDDLHSALKAALASLPERHRTVLNLRWNHGLSYDQISSALGISVQAAKMQVSRAQLIVRPVMEKFRPENG